MTFGLAIDPGKRRAGVTLFSLDTKRIVAAGLVSCDSKVEGPGAAVALARKILGWAQSYCNPWVTINYFVCELQCTYGGRASRGDANDLFPLAMLNGALAMALTANPNIAYAHYTPNEWKGGIEKPKTTKDPYPIESKVRERLSPEELASIEWPKNVKYTWDVVDACGIALKFLGRFERVRVYPRE